MGDAYLTTLNICDFAVNLMFTKVYCQVSPTSLLITLFWQKLTISTFGAWARRLKGEKGKRTWNGFLGVSVLDISQSVVPRFRSRDDVADSPQLLRAGEVDIVADKYRPPERLYLAHDVDAHVFGINAHEHVIQPSPYETVRTAHKSQVLIGRVHPVRPIAV